jgi:hypothetical protein
MFYKKFNKKSQIGIEYMVIIGFVLIVIMSLLGVAFFYSGSIRDRIKIIQINNFANKIITSSESVYYYGEPSKTTISVYLPESIENIQIVDNSIYITTKVSTGTEKTQFISHVPIEGVITNVPGIRKITITATTNKTTIYTL